MLIAGKGHETYQIVGTERRPFDDRVEARAALGSRREPGLKSRSRKIARRSRSARSLATGGSLLGAAKATVRGVVTDTRAAIGGKLFVALRGSASTATPSRSTCAAAGPRSCSSSAMSVTSACRWCGSRPRSMRSARSRSTVGARAAGRRGRRIGRQDDDAQRHRRGSRALAPGAVHFAPGNLNNPIGVPMVLFGLERTHRLAVVEIGTNHPGEVKALALVTEPDVAVLTVIGLEHAEGLGDLDAIEAEEGSAFSHLTPSVTPSATATTRASRAARALRRRAHAALRVRSWARVSHRGACGRRARPRAHPARAPRVATSSSRHVP